MSAILQFQKFAVVTYTILVPICHIHISCLNKPYFYDSIWTKISKNVKKQVNLVKNKAEIAGKAKNHEDHTKFTDFYKKMLNVMFTQSPDNSFDL